MEKETLEEREPYWDLVDAKAEQNNTIDLDAYAKGVQKGAKWQQERMYSEEDMRKVLLAIELINPVHLTILHSGHGEFPDGYKLTQKGVDYIIEQFKKK